MEKLITRYKVKTIIFSALLIIFGILFCVLPNSAMSALGVVVSLIMIVWGLFLVLGFCLAPKGLQDPASFIQGLFLLIFGVVIDFIPTLFVLLVGLVIMFLGLRQVFSSWAARVKHEKLWFVDFSVSILISLVGLLVAIFSWTQIAEAAISIMLGIDMILSGIFYLVLVFVLHRELAQLKSTFDETERADSGEHSADDFTDYTVDDDDKN